MHQPLMRTCAARAAPCRYYACEALYNIAKVARDGFVIFFNEAFDAMFRCVDACLQPGHHLSCASALRRHSLPHYKHAETYQIAML